MYYAGLALDSTGDINTFFFSRPFSGTSVNSVCMNDITVDSTFSSLLGTTNKAILIPRVWIGTQSADLYNFIYLDINLASLEGVVFGNNKNGCLKSYSFSMKVNNNNTFAFNGIAQY